MSYAVDSFANCEAILRRHAALYLRVGDFKERAECERVGIQGQWKPPTTGRAIAKMRRMRASGMTISDIARACKSTWRTTWKHTQGYAPKKDSCAKSLI